MNTKKMSGIVSLCLIVVALLLGSGTVVSQTGYPQSADKYVNDYAEILEPSDKAALRARLCDLDVQSGVELTVLTIDSIHNYDTGDATLESFATNLFNAWGIGDEERNDGVLILVAKSDRRVRIALGRGYGSQVDQAMQRVIDEEMVPHFQQADYDRGVIQGAEAVIDVIVGLDDVSSDGKYTARDAWLGLFAGLIGGGLVLGAAYAIARRSSGRRLGSSKQRRSKSEDANDYWRNWHDGGGSSGGGDSFGGGSSAGGGASGEW